MMQYSSPDLILFEVLILFPTISSAVKRREALIKTLKQIEEECVAVVSKRMKSVKIYLDRPPRKIVDALLRSNRRSDDLLKLRANRKNIIFKAKDGSIYMGDPYLHQTIEAYLELRASRNLRRLTMMKYNDVTGDIMQICGTLDKVDKAKYQGNKVASHYSRKNHICKICCNHHVGHGEYCSQRKNNIGRVLPVIDTIYSKPDISDRSVDYRNFADGRIGNSTNFKPTYSIKYPLFRNFETRLSTFRSWRRHSNTRSLAENGFFYQGVGDTTICYSCGVALKHWDPGDDSLLEHIRYSPTCNHLESLLGWKTVQECLEATSSDLREDHNEEYKRSNISARSPEYQSNDVRISTFGKFQNHNAISIEDVAKAGFFYTGMNDLVRCYWCDLGLKDWENGDDPYKEHARYQPDCGHLRNVKGIEFIKHIQKETHHLPKRHNKGHEASPGELLRTGTKEIQRENNHEDYHIWNTIVRDQYSDKEKSYTNILHTPAALSVLDAGYTEELVLAAIRRLDIKDTTKLTGSQIFQFILDAEDKGIDLTQNTQNNSGYESRSQNKNDEECQQLLAENQRLKSLMLCKQCQARERNILLLPCTHRSLCHECANEIKICPECWKPVKDRVRTYMA